MSANIDVDLHKVVEVVNLVIYTWNIPKGGLAKVILKEYYFFKAKNQEVSIITSDTIPNHYSDELLRASVEVLKSKRKISANDRVEISQFYPGLKITMEENVLVGSQRLFRLLKRKNPKLIVAHQLLSSFLTLPYCLVSRTPYVIVLHDDPFSFLKGHSNGKHNLLNGFLFYFVFLLSNIVIYFSKETLCTTSGIEDVVRKHLIIKKKMVLAEYGFDQVPRSEYKERNLLLTVSNWSKFRNPTAYLHLLNKLPEEIALTFAGQWSSEEDLREFRKLVENLKLERRVEILPSLSELELSELYDNTRVFIRLGFNEKGTGQAIIEALSHGCPVIISRSLGAADLIENGKHGFLVNEEDLEDVANKVSSLYLNKELSNQMSLSSYELTRENTWVKYLEILYNIVST